MEGKALKMAVVLGLSVFLLGAAIITGKMALAENQSESEKQILSSFFGDQKYVLVFEQDVNSDGIKERYYGVPIKGEDDKGNNYEGQTSGILLATDPSNPYKVYVLLRITITEKNGLEIFNQKELLEYAPSHVIKAVILKFKDNFYIYTVVTKDGKDRILVPEILLWEADKKLYTLRATTP